MRGSLASMAALQSVIIAALVTGGTKPAFCFPSLTADHPSTWWYEDIDHSNAQSSFMQSDLKPNYQVFRNVVKDFGADPTGENPASDAIQNAINAGPSGAADRTTGDYGSTMQPAMVYVPSGTYLMNSSLQLYLGTVLVGNPIDPPVFKATADFPVDHIVYGKDPNMRGMVSFFVGLKNIVIDSTAIDKDQNITLLDWTVSQASQLSNVAFIMPTDSTGHVGISTQYDYNSNIILNDLSFTGGAIGMDLDGQQWAVKGISFNGCTTGARVGCYDCVFLGVSCTNVTTCLDASGTTGSLTVIDSSISLSGSLVSSDDSMDGYNRLILENIQSDGRPTVKLNGTTVLNGSVSHTWVRGQTYSHANADMKFQQGASISTPRTSALLDGLKYFTMQPPTYQDYSASQVLNIKSVVFPRIAGDGVTDDTEAINLVLKLLAGCRIIYFPAGTYVVTDTIFVPAGSIIYGDAYASIISANGSKFSDPDSPTAMFQIGNPGDVGVAQVVDMMFNVADILPGCKLVEVNMAGAAPGDVALINSHMRVGGDAGSRVESNCGGSPAQCKAAWALIHLTASSSAYIENMWGWTADHDLDALYTQTISTGRGMLVEATQGTWLVGTAMEHNTLYQYNFNAAQNVFAAMQQSETPYWQGLSSTTVAPAPWSDNLAASDPDFANCGSNSTGYCGAAWFQRISNSRDLFLYGGCVWTFFTGAVDSDGSALTCDGDCQQEAIDISDGSDAIYLYGVNVHKVTNIVRSGGEDIANASVNEGGWGGVVAAFLYDA